MPNISEKLRPVTRARLAAISACGLAILFCIIAFVSISNRMGPPPYWRNRFYVAAGVVFLIAVWISRRLAGSRRLLVLIVGLGLLFRSMLFFTPDSVEADYYRYLWDGAMTAHLINPYKFAPQQVKDGLITDPVVQRLAAEASVAVSRINHPTLRSIYPPGAQVLFAVAYFIKPFSTNAWRMVLLASDLLTLWLVLSLLRIARLPSGWCLVFFWNPLFLVETYHYRHLDATLAPLLLLFLIGLTRWRPVLAGTALAVAVAIKLWPLLFVPFLVGRFWSERRKMVVAGVAFGLCCLVLLVPFLTAVRFESDSAVVAYSKTFDANEFAYVVFNQLGWYLSGKWQIPLDGRIIGRGILMTVLVLFSLGLARGARRVGLSELATRLGLVALLMLLLTPTLYPWYFAPVPALAATMTVPLLLVWTPLLSLTYWGGSHWWSWAVDALVHLPAWLSLVLMTRWTLLQRGTREE